MRHALHSLHEEKFHKTFKELNTAHHKYLESMEAKHIKINKTHQTTFIDSPNLLKSV